MRNKQKSFNLVHFVCGVFSSTILSVIIIWVITLCNQLNIDIDELNRQLTHYRNDYTHIQNKITYLSRSDRIHNIAKEKIKMIDSKIEPIDIVLRD